MVYSALLVCQLFITLKSVTEAWKHGKIASKPQSIFIKFSRAQYPDPVTPSGGLYKKINIMVDNGVFSAVRVPDIRHTQISDNGMKVC